MNSPHEILRLALAHDKFQKKWSDDITAGIHKEIRRVGYIEPRCYVLYYNHDKSRYIIHIIEMTTEDMKVPELNEAHYQTLRNIDRSLYYPALAVMFISEGKAPIKDTDEYMAFLVITFETRLKGWKSIYRLEKKSNVVEGGTTKTSIEAMVYDKVASASNNIWAIEKYAHILRGNYSDKSNEDIYN